MWTMDALQQMPEERFRTEVLIPLFKAMGYLDVVLYHGGPLEQGKDIVMWKRDDVRERMNYAVVAKSKPISGKVVGPSSSGEVVTQIQQCFGRGFQDNVTLEEQVVHRCIVACPHDLRKEAQNSITSALDPKLAAHVDFVCGQKLWTLIQEHLGAKTAVTKLHEAGRLMEDASPHHRIVATVRGSDIALSIQAKHPDAASDEPLEFAGTFAFPDTDEGRTAMGALERHFKTGAPVRIEAPYIEAFEIPPVLRPFLGDEVREIRLGPATSLRTFTFDMSFESQDGGPTVIPRLDFRVTQIGTDEGTLSCHSGPYRWTLTLDKTTKRIRGSLAIDISGSNVARALEAIRLWRVLAVGGKLSLCDSDTGFAIASELLSAGMIDDCPDAVEAFLSDLVYIQSRTRISITVPEREFNRDDWSAAVEISRTLRDGKIEHAINGWTLTMLRPGIEIFLSGPQSIGTITVASDDTVMLCDMTISLGRVARFVEGLQISEQERIRLKTLLESESTESAEIKLIAGPGGAHCTIVYLDHLPPEERARYPQFPSGREKSP